MAQTDAGTVRGWWTKRTGTTLDGPLPRALAAASLGIWRGRHAIGRATVARAYLRGRGLEIGALHRPLPLPRGAEVTYVDRMTRDQLRAFYPELASRRLVPVAVVDDSERLATIPDASQDFVVANHFLEHCQDPIGTLLTFLRVLRPGGVLCLAVPDKRFTFDRDRPVTPLAHLIQDHEQGPERSRRDHFEEVARLVARVPEDRLQRRVEQMIAADRGIHFYVWTRPKCSTCSSGSGGSVGRRSTSSCSPAAATR